MTLALVTLGGAVGAVLRYLTDRVIGRLADPVFPWGTLTVNLAGSLLLGTVTGAALTLPEAVVALLGTGLAGALSTYSTFGYETVRLFTSGARGYALGNVVANVAGSLAAAVAGLWLGTVLVG